MGRGQKPKGAGGAQALAAVAAELLFELHFLGGGPRDTGQTVQGPNLRWLEEVVLAGDKLRGSGGPFPPLEWTRGGTGSWLAKDSTRYEQVELRAPAGGTLLLSIWLQPTIEAAGFRFHYRTDGSFQLFDLAGREIASQDQQAVWKLQATNDPTWKNAPVELKITLQPPPARIVPGLRSRPSLFSLGRSG